MVGPTDGDGPHVAAAHHHALDDGLTAVEVVRAGSPPRPSGRQPLEAHLLARTDAGTARRGRRCRRASACPCRRGDSSSRSRRGARTRCSGSGTCCRTSSAPLRARTRDGCPCFIVVRLLVARNRTSCDAGAFAISFRNCSLDFVARILSVSSSRAAPDSSACNTRRRRHTRASSSVGMSSSSLRVPEDSTLIAGKMRFSDRLSVQTQLHVARSLELLEDPLVHARARFDQARSR